VRPVSRPLGGEEALRDARRERLTPAEWAWTYNGVALAPAYLLAVVALGWLADRVDSALPTLAFVWLAVLAALHLVLTLTTTAARRRRERAVLTRPLREGRHVWAVPDGERVRVYRLAEGRRWVPHAWPLALGYAPRVVEGREFDAEREAEEAHRWAADAERAALRPGGRGLARVLNDPR
jgi:hypothetical protein